MNTLPMSARGALLLETGQRGAGSGSCGLAPAPLAPAPLAPPTGPASPVVWAAAPTTAESEDPDARLMVLVGEGDRAAFRTLFRRYQAPLVNFVRRMVLDGEEAEDQALRQRMHERRRAYFTLLSAPLPASAAMERVLVDMNGAPVDEASWPPNVLAAFGRALTIPPRA